MEIQLLTQPDNENIRLGDFLKDQLTDPKWTSFYSAVAFLKKSGIQHIYNELNNFAQNNEVRMIAGVDLGGTSIEALNLLREALDINGEIWIFNNENNSTFHPKTYLFFNDQEAQVVIGSGNLTEGGIYTNYEVSTVISLSLSQKKDITFFKQLINMLNSWSIDSAENAKLLDSSILSDLISNDYIFSERDISKKIARSKKVSNNENKKTSIFKSVSVPPAPNVEYRNRDFPEDLDETQYNVAEITPVDAQAGHYNVFLMTLQKTDVGIGQTTKGKSRRSPEIFIPLSARDHDPDFWGWSELFEEDPEKPRKYDRKAVPIRIGGEIIEVNMMTWPDKSDFRLRSEAIRSAGNIGDILKLERTNGKNGYQYFIEIIPADSLGFKEYDDMCNNAVRGKSIKRWGYYK